MKEPLSLQPFSTTLESQINALNKTKLLLIPNAKSIEHYKNETKR